MEKVKLMSVVCQITKFAAHVEVKNTVKSMLLTRLVLGGAVKRQVTLASHIDVEMI